MTLYDFVPISATAFGCTIASGMSAWRGLDLRLRGVQRRAAAGALKVARLREEGIVLTGTPRLRDLHSLELQASSLNKSACVAARAAPQAAGGMAQMAKLWLSGFGGLG